MAKKTPHKEDINTAISLDKIAQIILVFTFIITILDYFFGDIYPDVFLSTSLILSLFYGILNFMNKFVLEGAENIRRKGLLDNSFGVKIGNADYESYYSNDLQDAGMKKLLMNTCENSFFTSSISLKMFKNSLPFLAFILASFILFAVIGFSRIPYTSIIVTILFSYNSLNLLAYSMISRRIFEDSLNLLKENSNNNYYSAYAIALILKYECNISKFGIILSEKVFNSQNSNLSTKWNEIKKYHNLK